MGWMDSTGIYIDVFQIERDCSISKDDTRCSGSIVLSCPDALDARCVVCGSCDSFAMTSPIPIGAACARGSDESKVARQIVVSLHCFHLGRGVRPKSYPIQNKQYLALASGVSIIVTC